MFDDVLLEHRAHSRFSLTVSKSPNLSFRGLPCGRELPAVTQRVDGPSGM